MITITDFLLVGAALFCVGIYMILAKRNAIQILIGIELMLNAAILNLVAFGKYDRLANAGQSFALPVPLGRDVGLLERRRQLLKGVVCHTVLLKMVLKRTRPLVTSFGRAACCVPRLAQPM